MAADDARGGGLGMRYASEGSPGAHPSHLGLQEPAKKSSWAELSLGGASSGSDDLEVVCSLPPVLADTRPGDTLVFVVGSALRQVGSHIGLADLLDHVQSPHAPQGPAVEELDDEAPELAERGSPGSRLRGVQTSPGSLFHMAEAHEAAVARRRRFTRQNSGGFPLNAHGSLGGAARPSSSHWGLHTLAFGAGLTDGLLAAFGGEQEEMQPRVRHIRELGLPPILSRRMSSHFSFASGSLVSLNAADGTLASASAACLQVAAGLDERGAPEPTSSRLESRRPSRACLAMGPQSTLGSTAALQAFPESSPEADATARRSSILDFEHLFMTYYVEVRPRWQLGRWASGARGPWRRLRLLRRSAGGCGSGHAPAVPALPTAQEVADAWKAEASAYILKNADACQLRWEGLRLSRRALERQLDLEVHMRDELCGPHARIALSLEPERVIHRLFWAIGDAVPPAGALVVIQKKLQARWPHCHIRCADDLFYPPSVFHTVLAFFTVALVLSVRVLFLAVKAVAAMQAAPARGHHANRQAQRSAHLEPTREERLDQLAARVLLTGSLAHLWMLHAMAASFPLRSLHSPFKRDLGCLAAYSPAASLLLRTVGPLAATAIPVAMAVRFDRLGLSLVVPKPGRPVGLHTGALLCSVTLPFMTGLVGWSVRSSLYSHHHLFIVLLFMAHLGTAFGFAAYFEMVQWAVYFAGANVMGGLFLYFRYTAEFTSARLLKAAQLQWACAHVVPVLGLLLAAALEVESGVARALVDFICENQDIIPTRLCIRFLREGDK